MYLKRFAQQSGIHQVLQAAMADTPQEDFTQSVRKVGSSKGFYWGTDPDGIPHHHMEQFLGLIEGEAATAFRSILDNGSHPADNALPQRWPARADTKHAIAWWMAAQILRTARQRERLTNLKTESLPLPRGLSRNNRHLEYIAKEIAPLAFLISIRPWGIGFTNLCLYTSDVPVQIINGQDDNDQLKAAGYWDIYLPLDPHRFLYLPGSMHRKQRHLMRDHCINLPGGLAMPLNDLMIENAHRHVFFHPEHDPRLKMHETLVADAVKRRGATPAESVLYYEAMPPNTGIERRWLDRHTWDEPNLSDAEAEARDPLDLVERMIKDLNSAKHAYRRF
jgi:hypothetical protein